MTQIGTIRHIARYPVKSMRGEALGEANIGFQGIPGDRAYTFVQEGLVNMFPFLTGRECPDMMRYQPEWEVDAAAPRSRPALMVRTPEGRRLPIESEELRADLERRAGRAVRLHSDYRGNHDVAYISIIGWPTIRALSEAAGVEPDHRRWRMTLVLDADIEPFAEREWLGEMLAIGDVRIAVTEQDRRCVMTTLDPETGAQAPTVLKKTAELNETYAGVYASVVATGTIRVGDAVRCLAPPAS